MAIPSELEYGATRPAAPSKASSKVMRLAAVSAAILVCMVGTVLLMAESPAEGEVEMEIITPQDKLNRLVMEFVKKGDKLSVGQMEAKLDQWRHNPDTLLDLPEQARTQMLADFHMQVSGINTMQLADDSTLCAKKDIIIAKFDQLLHKLGGEELSLNITNGKINADFQAALSSWLDSESNYRLTVQKAIDADNGAKYAEEQYEKYNTGYNGATKTYNTIRASTAAERQDLLDERNLIKQIMVMIGVLHDINATDEDIKAGGRNSVKNQYGVSDPYASKAPGSRVAVNPAELRAKMKTLEAMSLKVKVPKMGEMLHQLKSSLAEFAESDEVAIILIQMLQDIEDRMTVLNDLEASAKRTVEDMKAKLIEWQTKLVDLSNAQDKAKAAANAEQLQREKLAGQKKVAQETANDENSAYKLTITPYIKEIYIITMIKNKILDHCAQVAAAGR